MLKQATTRPVDRGLHRNYLKKADEFHASMLLNFKEGRWNACVVDAIHCAISCCDSLTVFHLGFRHAGERHAAAVELLNMTEIDKKELRDKTRQFLSLIEIKTKAEYLEELMMKRDADRAMKACERFYSWTREKLGV
jgi:hypothetical protein